MATVSRANQTKLGANRMVQLMGQWTNRDGPIYNQIANRIVDLVQDASLRPGDQLPPERALASALSVSRGTVVRAFEQLAAAAVVERIQGSGTVVAGRPVTTDHSGQEFVGERLWMNEGAAVDLLKAIPMMLPEVRELVTSIDLAPHAQDLDGAEPLGWWRLREWIAALHSRQGLPTTPHQILVTSGAQQAILLAVSTMARPGDVVLGEAHTWPGFIDTVQHIGARYEPVQLDQRGVVIDDLETKIDRFRPSLMVFNPQHQNPTGSRLPPDRVEAVAALAKRYRIPVVEDRVAADLGFDRLHLPAIDEFDTGGYGITIGSICKVAWPGLRLGWLRADAQIINRMRSLKSVADMFTPAVSQLLGLAIVDRYEEFVEARLKVLRPAADLVTNTIRVELPEWQPSPLRGGLCLWNTLPDGVSATAFVQHAGRCGVLIASGQQFSSVDGDSANIRIPYTAPLDEIAEGLRRLVDAWRTFNHQPTPETVI